MHLPSSLSTPTLENSAGYGYRSDDDATSVCLISWDDVACDTCDTNADRSVEHDLPADSDAGRLGPTWPREQRILQNTSLQ